MNNEIRNTLEEIYSYAEYLGLCKKDIPIILYVKEETLLGILEGKIVPSHAIMVAINVFHDALIEELANAVMEEYLRLYGKEE